MIIFPPGKQKIYLKTSSNNVDVHSYEADLVKDLLFSISALK